MKYQVGGIGERGVVLYLNTRPRLSIQPFVHQDARQRVQCPAQCPFFLSSLRPGGTRKYVLYSGVYFAEGLRAPEQGAKQILLTNRCPKFADGLWAP